MNKLDELIFEILDFVTSTDEKVTVLSADDWKTMHLGFSAYYVKDGHEYAILKEIRLADVKKAGPGSLFGKHIKSNTSRLELCSILSNAKSAQELRDIMTMNEALE